jgi:hypothetical protein
LESLAEEEGENEPGRRRPSCLYGRRARLLDTLARVGYLPDPAEARALLDVREVAQRMVSAVRTFREEVEAITDDAQVLRAADEVLLAFEEQFEPPDRATLRVVS